MCHTKIHGTFTIIEHVIFHYLSLLSIYIFCSLISTFPPLQEHQVETYLIVKKRRIKKPPRETNKNRPSIERDMRCCRPRLLESWMEDEEDEQQNKRKTSQPEFSTSDSSARAGSARQSLGGVSVEAISSGDTSVLINAEETNDSVDWSPEIPFENVCASGKFFSFSFFSYL